jgi:hypothetical protein
VLANDFFLKHAAVLIQRYSYDGRPGARSRVPGVPLEKRHLDIKKIQLANLGVHTLSIPKDLGDQWKRETEEIHWLCEYNAQVCEELGDEEKKNVWKLFADTVHGQINDDDKTYNGWGGKGGGALGVDMISYFFDYYEKLGDVQMLATMFCVLSGGFRDNKSKDHAHFLPKGRHAVFDTYIIRYAELLYCWGLLHTRAELNKHLKYQPANEHEFRFLCGERNESPSIGSNNVGRADGGLAITVLCATCGSETQPNNSGFCPHCQNFAFRCSICDMAVRGLCTFCETCHHGGHLAHIVEWFSTRNAMCPTGCGCRCSDFTTPLSLQQPQKQQTSLSVAADMRVTAPQEVGFAATM